MSSAGTLQRYEPPNESVLSTTRNTKRCSPSASPMSQSEDIIIVAAGQKRGPGRPPKSGLTPNKKQKRSSIAINELSSAHNASLDTPSPDRKPRTLPTRLHESQPLPTVTESQPLILPDAEYASIAESGVLARSLEQSRVSWTQTGIFDRYWTKPETGKNARPPPPNNPDLKSMKSRGKCRLRIEPHIFEVEVYVVEKPRVPPPPKQYIPARPQGLTQPWHHHHHQQSQSQSPSSYGAHTNAHVHAPQQPKLGATALDKKSSPDPVIGLLATKAGSDPELKALMREVAAGNAPPKQLSIFQRHIDELNAVLRAQKEKDREQEMKKFIPPPPGEVVFAFTTPGATSDRFLFPQHCILEALTPQHLLTSFMVTRKAETATNTSDVDVTKEYWSPVTIMVEVAYGREGILKDVHRWVKSPDESREHMKKVMAECERIPDMHLALRLPLKSMAGGESGNTSKVSTPVPQIVEDKKRRQSRDLAATKAARKRSSLAKGTTVADAIAAVSAPAIAAEVKQSAVTIGDDAAIKKENNETIDEATTDRRPVRLTRKSVRISEH